MKSYRRAAALLLTAALMMDITGCLNLDRSLVELEEETEETEVTEASETAVETVETSEETVPPTAPTVLSYSDNFSDAQTSYDAYVEFVDSFIEDYEGEVLFSYTRDYYHRDFGWCLGIVYPDQEMTEVYECVDGEVTYIGTLDYCAFDAMPYEVFSALPCMCDFHCSNNVYEMEDPIDGRYFGDIVAVSADGSSLLLLIGDPFILTEEEYRDLEEGDVIDTPPIYEGDDPGMTVTDILETGDHRYVQIDNGAECWFVQGSYTEDPTDYILMTNSDNPVRFNPRLVLVPLADNCDVTDTYSFLISNGDDSQFDGWNTDPEANALTSSVYWYFETEVAPNPPEVISGWLPIGSGLAYPVVIENGEVTSINIEWR